MKSKLIIIGAGGFAKSIIESINTTELKVIGFLDSYKQGDHQGFPILGSKLGDIANNSSYVYFVAIGDPSCRANWIKELNLNSLPQINIVDKTALISPTVDLGNGIYIGKMCIVNSDTKLADGVVINTRSLIEHGNNIGYCSNISTNVVLNGDVSVGDLTFVGSCSVVNGQLTIGNESIIGSGSVVIRDIPSKVVVAGTPTRLIKEIK